MKKQKINILIIIMVILSSMFNVFNISAVATNQANEKSDFILPDEIGYYDDGSGSANKVFVEGDYAYVADGEDGMEIFNITDPTNPIEIFQSGNGSNYGCDIFVTNDYAYLASGNGGFEIYNVSEPEKAEQTSFLSDSSWFCYALNVVGDYAYLAANKAGLIIINISDPFNPWVVGQYIPTSYSFFSFIDVQVIGNYAYIAGGYIDLIIIDVSDPNNPVEINSWDSDWRSSYGFYINESLVYIAQGYSGVSILDISNPLSLVIILEPYMSLPSVYAPCYQVYIKDNILYSSSEGVRLFNITNPTNPIQVSQFYDGGWAGGIFIRENFLFLADGGDGMEIIDISDLEHLVEIGQVDDDGGYASAVIIQENIAYVADSDDGLEIIDVSNVSHPVKVGQYFEQGEIIDLEINQDIAYLLNDGIKLEIINITNPTQPQKIGQFNSSVKIHDFCVVNDFAYLTTAEYGLNILNVSDPTQPTNISHWESERKYESLYSVEFYENRLYIGAGHRLLTLKIKDPILPVEVAIYSDDMFDAHYTTISDHYAYVSNYINYPPYCEEGLRIIDIRFPKVSYTISSYSTEIPPKDIVIHKDFAFLAVLGIEILDISSKRKVSLIGSVPSDNYECNDIVVKDNFIYYANGAGGLRILNGTSLFEDYKGESIPGFPNIIGLSGIVILAITWNLSFKQKKKV
ncbi:MAG: LVIVD repeat-containing protein [Promethearchaeota archaeon]